MLPLPYLDAWAGVEVEVNRNTAIVRRKLGAFPGSVQGRRGEVKAFSTRSQWRVRRVAADATPALVSQFGLTYHRETPSGERAKKHLDAWLQVVRRQFPGAGYLWVMEWQARGTLHFHVFLTVAPSDDGRAKLAAAWNRLAEPGSPEHLAFHAHPKNWISWAMGSGGYVAKYLDKARQKNVPEGWGWVGRFWGASRNLVPKGEVLPVSELSSSAVAPGPLMVRTLERYHRSKCRRWGVASRMFRRRTGGTVFGGGAIMHQLVGWLERSWERAALGGPVGPWGVLPG